MKKIVLSLLLGFASLSAGEINVAAAANLSDAIEALKKEFNAEYPETKVQVILGSSGKLTAQIKHGAPFEIFMSADMKFPELLYSEKLALKKPVIYAQGALVLLSSKERKFDTKMTVLKSNDIKKIAIANPQTAPYGVAAIEAIKNAGMYEELKEKFVYAESISQAVAYATGAADIGFVAKSSLFSPQMSQYKESVHWSDISKKLYTPIDQGVVILKKGKGNDEAKAFYDFILSPKGQEIFMSFGYEVE